MTRRNKILGGTALLFATALLTLALVLSYDAACPAAEALPRERTATAPDTTTERAAKSMQAARYHCYGDPQVITWETVPRPDITDSGVLVRVHAAATNPLDWHFMRGKPYIMRLSSGIGRPNDERLGADFAGVVEAVGASVTRFAPGDSVFGSSSGAFGQYVVVREAGSIARLPNGVSLEQAAVVGVAATTALQAVRDVGQVASGQRVLVNGASGGVGTYAVQIAKAMGAHVTGVASTRNVELVQSLGADTVIDYTRDDFTTHTAQYDVIIDNVGNHAPSALRRVLTATGRVVMVGGPDRDRWLGPIRSLLYAIVYGWFTRESFSGLLATTTSADLSYLSRLMTEGKLRSIIDRRFEASQLRDAIAYQEAGRSRGKNVVLIP